MKLLLLLVTCHALEVLHIHNNNNAAEAAAASVLLPPLDLSANFTFSVWAKVEYVSGRFSLFLLETLSSSL